MDNLFLSDNLHVSVTELTLKEFRFGARERNFFWIIYSRGLVTGNMLLV